MHEENGKCVYKDIILSSCWNGWDSMICIELVTTRGHHVELKWTNTERQVPHVLPFIYELTFKKKKKKQGKKWLDDYVYQYYYIHTFVRIY